MDMLVYLLAGLVVGTLLGWFIAKASKPKLSAGSSEEYIELDKAFTAYRATCEANLQNAEKSMNELSTENKELVKTLETTQYTLAETKEHLGILSANYKSLEAVLETEKEKNSSLTKENGTITLELNKTYQNLATANADYKGTLDLLQSEKNALGQLKTELKTVTDDLNNRNQALATANADNKALNDKLITQKSEMEELGKKFNIEFENIANKILETKTEKFTELNKTNLKDILDPLGEHLKEFKTKVEEVYDKESKERFSLGEKVKELSLLNQMISEDAKNLTKALKGEAKTQGNWGEMILESILERSGLVKDREYFMEHELLGEDGKPLRSDSEGKKMRPDAVIKYPDNRSVIIDSKVSLSAFTRLIASIDVEEQKKELAAHVTAIKAHIVSLSAKGYDDYDKALDFVMLFVPSEPAYIAALQSDPDLWNFAYDKRILLLSPTNLITSLKLIVDLWKREYQNRNAIDIAERGAKLYDKFVGFVENLTDVGEHLDKAKGKYDDAFKQLSTGKDNLVLQTSKLKDLGLKNKKSLPQDIVNAAVNNDLIAN
jgi:DNA recombination protein RmuC